MVDHSGLSGAEILQATYAETWEIRRDIDPAIGAHRDWIAAARDGRRRARAALLAAESGGDDGR